MALVSRAVAPTSGDVKRLQDLELPAGVELLDDPERTVASLYIPAVEVPEEEVAEEVEGEEPLAEAVEAGADESEPSGEDAGDAS